jgi:hypothetical protein
MPLETQQTLLLQATQQKATQQQIRKQKKHPYQDPAAR